MIRVLTHLKGLYQLLRTLSNIVYYTAENKKYFVKKKYAGGMFFHQDKISLCIVLG